MSLDRWTFKRGHRDSPISFLVVYPNVLYHDSVRRKSAAHMYVVSGRQRFAITRPLAGLCPLAFVMPGHWCHCRVDPLECCTNQAGVLYESEPHGGLSHPVI